MELSFRSLKKGFHGPFLSDPFSIKKKLAGHPEKSEFQPKTEMSRNVAPKPPCYPSRGCFFGIFVCWELFRGNLWPLGLKIVIGGHASRSTFSFGRTANSQTKKKKSQIQNANGQENLEKWWGRFQPLQFVVWKEAGKHSSNMRDPEIVCCYLSGIVIRDGPIKLRALLRNFAFRDPGLSHDRYYPFGFGPRNSWMIAVLIYRIPLDHRSI